MIKITYDPVADAVYIYLSDPDAEVTTQEMDEDVNIQLCLVKGSVVFGNL